MKGEKGVRDSELKTEGKRKSSLSTPEKKIWRIILFYMNSVLRTGRPLLRTW